MDLMKVYGLMRSWELNREKEQNMLNGFIELDTRILKICKELQEQTKANLIPHGVDVEYIMYNLLPYLKREAWINDHGIKINKNKNGEYEYELYEIPINADTEPLKIFTTLEEAVAEALSYYPELAQIKTVEQVVSELEFK